jgi:hypothetical protein
MLVSAVAVLATSSGTFLAKVHQQNPELDSQGLTDHTILVLSYVLCAVFVLWSAAAGVTAVLVFRGTVWAWYLLIISTVAVTGFCLLAAISSLLMLVPLMAAGLTLGLLLRPEARAWFGR